MRRPLVAGNWKMNTTAASGRALIAEIAEAARKAEGVDVLVAPPSVYLSAIKEAAGDAVHVAAQNVYFEDDGAFTGELSVAMLEDIGCDAVLIGHSERRHVLGETDAMLNKKVHKSLAGGLPVILCVGELLDERKSGSTNAVLDQQMTDALDGVESVGHITIAYEPVWAIGTGETATPDQAEEAHKHLREWVAAKYGQDAADTVRILYGGSVKPANAAELIGQPNVDGALVGGASLKADQFVPIIQAAG